MVIEIPYRVLEGNLGVFQLLARLRFLCFDQGLQFLSFSQLLSDFLWKLV